jgi:hypothetical protein
MKQKTAKSDTTRFVHKYRTLLTPEAAAVTDRLVRDYGLTISAIITAAMNDVMSGLEEDVAEDGGTNDGVFEQIFVRNVKRAAAGKPLNWQLGETHPDYKIGSKSYADTLKGARDRRRRRRLQAARMATQEASQ